MGCEVGSTCGRLQRGDRGDLLPYSQVHLLLSLVTQSPVAMPLCYPKEFNISDAGLIWSDQLLISGLPCPNQ